MATVLDRLAGDRADQVVRERLGDVLDVLEGRKVPEVMAPDAYALAELRAVIHDLREDI